MPGLAPGFYAQWSAQNEARLLLRERVGPHPPERLLQSVWHHQRLRRDQLQTVDGRTVRVLHPGFWNHEAGPDFRGAVVQIGQEEARSGDIEIDLERHNWQTHHHQDNPAFANVILHVVWHAGPGAPGPLPTLVLEKFLDTPFNEALNWAGSAAATAWPDDLRGACAAPLAELLPRLGEAGPSLLDWPARLFGVSGFLGASHEKSRHNEYLQTLWDHWWHDRENFQEVVLPKTLWCLHGLRPANQPQRRLALAAHWLAARDFPARLEEWFTTEPTSTALPQSLLSCLQPPQDDYWSRHWSFQSPRLAKAQPLLGAARATDLAINVILPWFWTRAQAGRNQRLTQLAEQRFLAWPPAQDNSLLRLARQRLLGRQAPGCVKSAASQQGLLQIVRDFCDHSNAVCADCSFPDVVRQCASCFTEETQRP